MRNLNAIKLGNEKGKVNKLKAHLKLWTRFGLLYRSREQNGHSLSQRRSTSVLEMASNCTNALMKYEFTSYGCDAMLKISKRSVSLPTPTTMMCAPSSFAIDANRCASTCNTRDVISLSFNYTVHIQCTCTTCTSRWLFSYAVVCASVRHEDDDVLRLEPVAILRCEHVASDAQCIRGVGRASKVRNRTDRVLDLLSAN